MQIHYQPDIVVLGAGGHGIQSILPFLVHVGQQEIQSHILYTPADYGGSTGIIIRLLELNNYELNTKLHGGDLSNILPFGDLTKLIDYFLNTSPEYKKTEASNIINLRSSSTKELVRRAIQLYEILQIPAHDFVSYIKTYMKYEEQYAQYLDAERTSTCLGNLWMMFVYSTNGSHTFNSFFHHVNILPKSINTSFTSANRQILIGSTAQDELLLGEDVIDTTPTAVIPSTLQLMNHEGRWDSECIKSEYIKMLENASLILIPNGSIANWLALINSSYTIRSILRDKGKEGKVYMVANLFYTSNEFPLEIYLELVSVNYDIPLNVLLPTPVSLTEHMHPTLITSYLAEGKHINQFDSPQFRHITSHPNIALHYSLNTIVGNDTQGIKYNTDDITAALSALI